MGVKPLLVGNNTASLQSLGANRTIAESYPSGLAMERVLELPESQQNSDHRPPVTPRIALLSKDIRSRL